MNVCVILSLFVFSLFLTLVRRHKRHRFVIWWGTDQQLNVSSWSRQSWKDFIACIFRNYLAENSVLSSLDFSIVCLGVNHLKSIDENFVQYHPLIALIISVNLVVLSLLSSACDLLSVSLAPSFSACCIFIEGLLQITVPIVVLMWRFSSCPFSSPDKPFWCSMFTHLWALDSKCSLLGWLNEHLAVLGRRRTRQALRTEPMFACDGQDLRANNLNHHQKHFLRFECKITNHR